MRCPCRKKSETITYESCCEPLHLGIRHAATPERLMRSRYAAFALRNATYLNATWHPSTRPAQLDFTPGQEWLSLKIDAVEEKGGTGATSGTVTFTARSLIGGASQVLRETSRFVREDGRWLYLDGVIG